MPCSLISVGVWRLVSQLRAGYVHPMDDGGSTAVVVAIIALVVSVAAAGFTGWQAFIAHLERTKPRPASFTLTEPRRSYEGLVVTNTGGSIATSIRVTIPFVYPEGRKPLIGSSDGALAPGASAHLKGTEEKALPRGRWVPTPDKAGTLSPATAETGEGFFVVGKYASVEWRDYRGRKRAGRIGLR